MTREEMLEAHKKAKSLRPMQTQRLGSKKDYEAFQESCDQYIPIDTDLIKSLDCF